MDEELQDLFRAKGLSDEHLELIMATDPTLCSVEDLASGAVSETDARSWADEMGLDSRVLKSRFIQSWLQARDVFLRMLEEAYSPLPSGSSTPQLWPPQAGCTMSPGGKLSSGFQRGSGLGDDDLEDEEVLNEKSILVHQEAFMAICASRNSSHLDSFDPQGFDFLRKVPAQGTLSGSTTPTRSSVFQMPLLPMETEMDQPRTARSLPGTLSSEDAQEAASLDATTEDTVTTDERALAHKALQEAASLDATTEDTVTTDERALAHKALQEAASLDATTEDTVTTDERALVHKALQEIVGRGSHKGNSFSSSMEASGPPGSAGLAEEHEEPTKWERMDVDSPVMCTRSQPVRLQLTERMMAGLEEASAKLRSESAAACEVQLKLMERMMATLEEASAKLRSESASACETPEPTHSQIEVPLPLRSQWEEAALSFDAAQLGAARLLQDLGSLCGAEDCEAPGRPDDEVCRQIVPAGVEECATEGGLSTPLLGILRQSGLTSSEIKLLHEKISPRTIREVVSAWRNEEEVMRAGKDAGLISKVSIGHLVLAWHECVATVAAARQPLATIKERQGRQVILKEGPREYPLNCMNQRGDYATACNLLMQRLGKNKKTELVPLLKGLLGHISSHVYRETPDGRQVQVTSRKVLPVVASAYGRDVAIRVGRKAEVEEAEARWTWTIKTLFNTRMTIALQQETLKAYRSESFQACLRELRERWQSAEAEPLLEEKTVVIEALCFEKVLRRVLPRYGFPPTREGVEDMRATVRRHCVTCGQARQLRMEALRAVLDTLPM